MRSVRSGPAIGLLAQLGVLVVLALTTGLGASGWIAGVAFGVLTYVALSRAMTRVGAETLWPASRVTMARATLVGGVTALTADALDGSAPMRSLVGITVVALLLDAVDGWVARRTGTVSALGAHFDEEVDAFLILVLSVFVAHSLGWWVLTIGLAHYAVVAAAWWLPWLREPLPPRYWNKVVAAIQGITLTVAAADVLPRTVATIMLSVALAPLAESFGREVWSLRRQRHIETTRLLVAADRGHRVH